MFTPLPNGIKYKICIKKVLQFVFVTGAKVWVSLLATFSNSVVHLISLFFSKEVYKVGRDAVAKGNEVHPEKDVQSQFEIMVAQKFAKWQPISIKATLDC